MRDVCGRNRRSASSSRLCNRSGSVPEAIDQKPNEPAKVPSVLQAVRRLFVPRRPVGEMAKSSPSADPSDFERSALRFLYEVMLVEYRALRDEVNARIQKQQEITSFAIAVAGGFVALTQLVGDDKNPLHTLGTPGYLFPIISFAFSAFTMMTLDHEMNIAHIQNYIDNLLRPKMEFVLSRTGNIDASAWEWNAIRSGWQQHKGWRTIFPSSLAGSKYALTMLPSLTLLTLFWFTSAHGRGVVQMAIYVVALLSFLVTAATAWYTSSLYLRMNRAKG